VAASDAAKCARFSHRARGEIVWFNVCLSVFKPRPLFDALLRPAKFRTLT
jgi:hypothetical protein